MVGLSTALALRLGGREVRLFDPEPPASGCSSGNAGFIATSEAFPLASLERLLRAPQMLCDPLGPLAIRPRSLFALAPWLTSFALNALPQRRARGIAALAALNALALPAHRRLLTAAAARHLLVERGMLELVARGPGAARAIRDLRRDVDALNRLGVEAELVGPEAAGDLEPELERPAAAAFHPRVAHVRDPLAVGLALNERLRRDGQVLDARSVRRLEPLAHGCRLHLQGGGSMVARQVVVAAGVWSRDLLRPLGVQAPLAPERGYHLMLPRPGVTVTRPLSFRRESFVATPMDGGLRLAGTAEFADVDSPPDWRRARQLVVLARRYLPRLEDEEATPWMGARPSMPDSLPAIGRLTGAPQVLYAFGHQHLGLTQAAVTGECIAALAAGRTPPLDLRPYDIERFAPG